MDVFYLYTYGSSAWLAVQGMALVATPKLIVTLLVETEYARPPTDIETYYSRAFGIALLAVATMTVLLTGSVPLASSVDDPASTEEEDLRAAPYAGPAVLVTSLFHSALAFYNYTWYVRKGQAALAMGMIGSAVVASVGLWCLLFATTKGRVSQRTGADKRTSGFPFKNAEADRRHARRKEL